MRDNNMPANAFLDALFVTKGTERTMGDYLDNIRIPTKRMNKQTSDVLTGAAMDLLNINAEVAKRIFKATLVQSGLNNSPMSYHNLLPAQWFHSLVREALDVYREGNFNQENVIDDFYRNNWVNNKLVPKVSSRSITRKKSSGNVIAIRDTNNKYNQNLYVKQWAIPEGITKKEFYDRRKDEAVAQDEKPKFELRLYKFMKAEEGYVYFERVNPLGDGGRFTETSVTWKAKSFLNANNKVDGEIISSQEFLNFVNFTPETKETVQPESVPVSDEVKAKITLNLTEIQETINKLDKKLDYDLEEADTTDNGVPLMEKRDKLYREHKVAVEQALSSIQVAPAIIEQVLTQWNIKDSYIATIERAREKALFAYRMAIAKGMTEKQAEESAIMEVTCPF